MDTFDILFTQSWRVGTAVVVGLAGLIILGQGLVGARGLLRRRIELIDRLASWQQTLSGLTLVGLATAWALDSRLFLFLTLGIAFTELREASTIVNAMKRDRRRHARAGA